MLTGGPLVALGSLLHPNDLCSLCMCARSLAAEAGSLGFARILAHAALVDARQLAEGSKPRGAKLASMHAHAVAVLDFARTVLRQRTLQGGLREKLGRLRRLEGKRAPTRRALVALFVAMRGRCDDEDEAVERSLRSLGACAAFIEGTTRPAEQLRPDVLARFLALPPPLSPAEEDGQDAYDLVMWITAVRGLARVSYGDPKLQAVVRRLDVVTRTRARATRPALLQALALHARRGQDLPVDGPELEWSARLLRLPGRAAVVLGLCAGPAAVARLGFLSRTAHALFGATSFAEALVRAHAAETITRAARTIPEAKPAPSALPALPPISSLPPLEEGGRGDPDMQRCISLLCETVVAALGEGAGAEDELDAAHISRERAMQVQQLASHPQFPRLEDLSPLLVGEGGPALWRWVQKLLDITRLLHGDLLLQEQATRLHALAAMADQPALFAAALRFRYRMLMDGWHGALQASSQ